MLAAVVISFLLQYFSLISCQNFVHPLTNPPGPSKDIETTFLYPELDKESLKLPIGKTSVVLCHVVNDGRINYNITAIMGSLNHPNSFGLFIQNYSYKQIGVVIKPGDEMTFQYEIEVHKDLENAQYNLAHILFYESDRSAFSTTFFNEVII